jgi:hypothetical protein
VLALQVIDSRRAGSRVWRKSMEQLGSQATADGHIEASWPSRGLSTLFLRLWDGSATACRQFSSSS